MSRSHDLLLGQAAVERGLLSRTQLEEILGRQARDAHPKSLAVLLIEKGYLTAAQVVELAPAVDALSARPPSADPAATLDAAPAPTPAPPAPPARPASRIVPSASPPRRDRPTSGLHARAIATQAGHAPPPRPADTPSSALPRRSAVALEGACFGKYRLEEHIGAGGMGTVYRALDTELHRTVAVKVLAGGDDLPGDRVKRFQREAATAGKLRHPNIVTIFEVGCHEGHHYFAMDYVEGTTLAHLIHERKLKLDDALDLFLQTADAIDCAHRHNVIHRDLKPQNIMVDREQHAFVTDFGLAKEIAAHSKLTQTGGVLGTPMYMAPEQASGEGGDIDGLTDVYGLGAILYEILTARPPFEGDSSAQILYAVLFKDPVPPTRRNRRVPQDLETICLKALEKEKHRRYASARVLADDVRRFKEGEPISAKPVGTFSRALRRVRRHRGALLGGAAAVLLAAAAVGYAVVHTREAEARNRDTAAREARLKQDQDALELKRKAREEAATLLRQSDNEPLERALELCGKAIAACPESWEAYVRRGTLFSRNSRSAEAIADFTQALEIDPKNLQVLRLRGDTYAWQLRDHEHAAADFKAMLALDPGNVLALEAQACLLLLQGQNVSAAEAFTKVIEQDPKRWGPYYYRGIALQVGHNQPQAIEDFTAALERKPDDPAQILMQRACAQNVLLEAAAALADADQALLLRPRYAAALLERALALKTLGRRDEAIKAAEEGIALEPKNAEFIARLAQVHRQFNDLPATLAASNRALAINPRCIMALSTRAEVYIQHRKYREAIADCDLALADSDFWSDAHELKGEALYGLGDLDRALKELTRAIELDPFDPHPCYTRAQVYQAAGDAAHAALDLQKHIDLLKARKNESAAFQVVLGRALVMAGRTEEALAAYTKALDREPGFGEALKNRAALLVHLGRGELAILDAQKYVETHRDDFDAHRLTGIIYLVLGQAPEAVQALEEAARLHPGGTAEIWNNLAHAYNVQGLTDKAVQALERGLALDPTEPGLLYNLACLQGKTGAVDRAVATFAKAIAAGWDHFATFAQDPDMRPLEAEPSFGEKVAEACIDRAKRTLDTAYTISQYAAAQSKVECERAVAVLSFALGLGDRVKGRSAQGRLYWYRSTAWSRLHERARQIADLAAAARCDANWASRWHHALGEKALDEGRTAEAIDEFTTAIKLEPDLADAWCDRGKARLLRGDRAGARTDLETGFEKRPELKPYYQTEWQQTGER